MKNNLNHIVQNYKSQIISFIVILFLFSSPAEAKKYFISPSGNDNNTGTYSAPYFTLNKAWAVVSTGDTIYMRGGTYLYNNYQNLRNNKHGTAGNMIKIWAYPGENPVITRSASNIDNRGIVIVSNYLYLKGIEITGFQQLTTELVFPITIESIGGIFENLKIHDNSFGIMVGGISDNCLFLNCDAYRNSDPISGFDGADGISIRGTNVNSVNTIRGCRIWWNSDDGVDLYGNAGTIIEENSWAFWNGYRPGTFTTAGNGMGFKYGPIYGSTTEVKRIGKNLIAFENRLGGFDQSADGTSFPVVLYNCTAYKNGVIPGGTGYFFDGSKAANILRNNIRYANGNEYGLNSSTIQDHNSWNNGVTLTNVDFISLSSVGMDGPRQADGSLPFTNFLRPAAGSKLIDKGVNVGLAYMGNSPDLGAFESAAGSVNQPPAIQNQSFQINKNSSNGTVVGSIQASDLNTDQALTFSILSGNTDGAFAINTSTGLLTVSNSSALSIQTNSSFVIVVKVQDNGTGLLSSQANITVNLLTVTGCSATGNITYQVWNNIGNSTSVSSLTSNSNYPNNPTSSTLITSMEGTTNLADNYGARIAGYICAPATGSYTFWIAGDDYCELWLSSNDQAANKQKIAFHTSWTNSREWNKFTTQKSTVINLIQGGKYYIEALLKEAGGGDNLAVGWLKPGQSGTVPSEVIPGSVLSPIVAIQTLLVTSVSLPSTSFVNKGSSAMLLASVLPSSATNSLLSWSSSNSAIAVVDNTGLVTGISEGNTIITAISTDGSNKSAFCSLTVNPLVSAASGNITYQIWNNIGNSVLVSNLTSNSNFPNNPTSSTLITSMEGYTNLADNYGARIAGYISAPATGSYTFWIAGDDYCELWLSSDDQATNKQNIAFHTSWTNPREWNKFTTQKSAVINLVQGKRYYIEALMKEAGGGDNLAVGWIKPGQTGSVPSEIIPGSVLSPLGSKSTEAKVENSTFPDKDIKLLVFPNPLSNDMLNISIENITTEAELQIFSITGIKCYDQVIQNSGTIHIDRSIFRSGIYIIKVYDEYFIKTTKLVVN